MDFLYIGPSKFFGQDVDSVLSVICRHTNRAKLIPYKKEMSAQELADLYWFYIYKDFGLPNEIVSHRDKLFISNFWTAFCKILNIKRELSTSYYPQTDSSTER